MVSLERKPDLRRRDVPLSVHAEGQVGDASVRGRGGLDDVAVDALAPHAQRAVDAGRDDAEVPDIAVHARLDDRRNHDVHELDELRLNRNVADLEALGSRIVHEHHALGQLPLDERLEAAEKSVELLELFVGHQFRDVLQRDPAWHVRALAGLEAAQRVDDFFDGGGQRGHGLGRRSADGGKLGVVGLGAFGGAGDDAGDGVGNVGGSGGVAIVEVAKLLMMKRRTRRRSCCC